MYVQQYSKEYQLDINRWLNNRGLNTGILTDFTLPEVGYVVLERGEPIAAGFIRKCEGGYGMFDGFVTNPDAPGDLRDTALNTLTQKLIETSKELGLTHIVSFSTDNHTIMRAERFGFRQLPHTLIALALV